MKVSQLSIAFLAAVYTGEVVNAAFTPSSSSSQCAFRKSVEVRGYLDDLTEELYAPDANPVPEEESEAANKMSKDQIDRYGPGNWENFVDFDEFDGGDGQMGVAGDGKKGLDKEDFQNLEVSKASKSKYRSAKNAWGTFTGYADKLIEEKGMDRQVAQRLENWANQQEVKKRKQAARDALDFDKVSTDEENWRSLAAFGLERNEDFDFEERFGPVTAGEDIAGTIELKSLLGKIAIHEFKQKNEFMGYSDFRAAFTPDTPKDWTVVPSEGSINSTDDINFVVKLRPENPGTTEGFLVIETEDFKKTWKVIGSTS